MRSRIAVSFGEKLALDLLVAEDAPPLAQALVVPQDVNLILGDVDPVVEEAGAAEEAGTAEEAVGAGAGFRPRRLGSVTVLRPREGKPLVLQAIVYDFDKSPPAREEHVFEALMAAFEEARARGLARVAVRPIGTAHAGLQPALFLRQLVQVCYTSAELGTSVRRVFLLIPSPDEMERYQALLKGLIEKLP
jgi:O-acetyl-ADP-ribose deacetylase (regulator of RNase III)